MCLIGNKCFQAIVHAFVYNRDIQGYTLYFFAQSINCGYSLEPHHIGGPNEYTYSIF